MPVPLRNRQISTSAGGFIGFLELGDPSGAPVFYFHGGLSSRLDIAFGAETCTRMGIRLIAPDRPGIGLSTFQKRRTLLAYPSDMAELADSLNIHQFSVIGWSAGGIYALACAFALPDRVTKAVTVGGMCPIDAPGRVAELGMSADRLLFPLTRYAPVLAALALAATRLRSPEALQAEFLREVQSPGDRQVLAAMTTDEIIGPLFEALRPGVMGTVEDYRIMGSPWGFPLTAVRVPCQVWQGEEDTLLPRSHAQKLIEGLPRCSPHIVPGAGHFLLRTHLPEILQHLAARDLRVAPGGASAG